MAKRKNVADDGVTTTKPSPKRLKRSPIDRANTFEPEDFRKHFLDDSLLTYGTNDTGLSKVSLHFAEQLTLDNLHACFRLIETTSRNDYEASSWQWHPRRKKREMKEEQMRYLIVTSAETGAFEGFLSVMLTHDSTPVVPVLYVYEIHLNGETRGKGLGKHLMILAEDIAKKVGVAKVMLTCFKSNVRARAFYKGLSYAADKSSPRDIKTRLKVHKHDYVIMSKDMRTLPDEETERTEVSGGE